MKFCLTKECCENCLNNGNCIIFQVKECCEEFIDEEQFIEGKRYNYYEEFWEYIDESE